ncbi:MAG TPA: carboxypeptidase-like regulatory domain-containing protein [Pyrinomonadaceae bacterium]|nr:carboxypeptidase-like regulatory domain-containing protein [Pyrinomonadaceae bacterium]
MRKTLRVGLALAALAWVLCGAGAPQVFAGGRIAATVSGSVRDNKGNPIAGAIVSLIKDGADEIIKQVKSAADGSFIARIAPGRYSLRAVAAGFNAVLFDAVQVRPADEVVYRFNLEPVGSGRTAPERRKDRDDRKWMLRSRAGNRSIFQAGEGEDETINAVLAAQTDVDAATGEPYEVIAVRGAEEETSGSAPRTQGVVETYVASSAGTNALNFAGVNFAVARPVSERVDLIFAGQTGVGQGAPQRLEVTASVRAGDTHRLRLSAAGGLRPKGFGPALDAQDKNLLGQLSLRAVDEWVVRDGVVVVLGLDYSRFLGAGGAQAVSPRLGVQFDANPKTRVHAAYAPGTDWASAAQSIAEFEDSRVIFREPVSTPVAYVDGRAVMERSHRLEFGVERVLDNESSIEATAFFDMTSNRGVGLFSAPLSAFAGEAGAPLMSVANQEGAARGLRVVYARRISSVLHASAGYSFGRGQQLSARGLVNPADFFDDGFFQTAALEVSAHLDSGTRVRTIFRFSPRATVFAIDPFAGRLAVYDPSLSILVTQELPSFGLPVRAQAVIDARNLLDAQATAEDGESFTSVDAGRRSVRGGISVRF